jgi:hypothetical protein
VYAATVELPMSHDNFSLDRCKNAKTQKRSGGNPAGFKFESEFKFEGQFFSGGYQLATSRISIISFRL